MNVLFFPFWSPFCRHGGRPWHRLCRHERGSGMMMLLILTSVLGYVLMGFKQLA